MLLTLYIYKKIYIKSLTLRKILNTLSILKFTFNLFKKNSMLIIQTVKQNSIA